MKNFTIPMILVIAMVLSVFTGCSATAAGAETSSPTSVATTAPKETTAAVTEQGTAPDTTETTVQEETAPPETDTPVSDPSVTTAPPETEPQETEPAVTTQPTQTTARETEPPTTTEATEPPHEHSYSIADTVAPACTSDGYTVYQCSCGSKYTDNETSATGHCWSDWSVTREATASAEGEQARTCTACGATETAAIEKLPAEPIDTAALESYGRQYAANTYGYEPVVGTRAGYYPGLSVTITDMDDGRNEVAGAVDATTRQLIAAGASIVVIIDGQECAAMIDIEIVHEGNNDYRIWVYYG